jgi:hypothetical protein
MAWTDSGDDVHEMHANAAKAAITRTDLVLMA